MQNEKTELADADENTSTENGYSIRRATREDFSIAFALAEEYFREVDVLVRDTSEEFAAYLEDGGVWLAFNGERPVGCIVLRRLGSPPNIGELKRLYVRVSHRKQGLADRLLRAAEQYAMQVPYQWLYLDTKDDLKSAIRFYRRHGYERCDRYNSNPQATIFMRKRVSNA
jgi:ribosomal protein S18 acetylase RimI-like enzyme